MNGEWKEIIETAWENRNLLDEQATQACIRNIIEEIDKLAEDDDVDGETFRCDSDRVNEDSADTSVDTAIAEKQLLPGDVGVQHNSMRWWILDELWRRRRNGAGGL